MLTLSAFSMGETMRTDRLAKIMQAAAANGILVPAFNVPYLPMAKPIAETLAKHGVFGMMEVARLETIKFEARSLAAVHAEYLRYADPSIVTLHFDHCPVIDEDGLRVDWESSISEAIALGFDSVMVDGSRLPLDENIAVTARVVEMAHVRGVVVEAELGAVMGHEAGPLPPYDELFESKKGFTDPGEAREFVQRTGVDWLSVSVGSVHGAISGAARNQAKVAARIDIEHLKKLRDATGVPLVLHGGSGVQQAYVDEAIRCGMAKINIGTDIRQPYERALASGGSVADAQSAVADKIGKIVCDVYHLEGTATKLNG
jgi:ketose-bisphosphate aldolase